MHKNTISVSRYHTPKEKPVAASWDSPQEDPEQQHCKPRLHRAHEMGHHRPILCMHTNCRLLLAEQPPLCLTLEPPATRVGVWATVGLQWWTGGEMNFLSLCLTTTKQSLGGWETLVGPRSPPASPQGTHDI